MAKIPINFDLTDHGSPDLTPNNSDEDDIQTPRVTQTMAHPYMLGKVRMRKKRETIQDDEENPNMHTMSLRVELENAKTELNRRTVLFSNHYNDMVGKWQTEKTKREVAENVAVEKARDNVVLQRTHISLKKRAKQSTEGIIEVPDTGEEGKRDTIIGDENVVNLTEENEKLNLELQDLKETVALLEDQISNYKQENEDQVVDLQNMNAKMVEMENDLKQNRNYMQTAQHQYKNLAGRFQDEKGKREIAENVAVNKARELEVQKRTSVMVLSSLNQSFCPDFSSVAESSLETMDYATRISSLETEIEDLRESKLALENIVTKFEQECTDKDSEIRGLREKIFVGSYSRSPLEGNICLSQSLAIGRDTHGDMDEIVPCLVPATISPYLLRNPSIGTETNVSYRTSNLVKGGTLDRPRHKKVSGMQTQEQLQQELKSKEAMINIMKLKLESMKMEGSKEDPELEIQRRQLEDQVGGLDRKLSSMNTEEKNTETEVDELREKLENVEKKAADFEEKTRYYQELLNKMNQSSGVTASPRVSPTPDAFSPVNIPAPPPNLPPPPPPPLPEGLFGPATPHLVIRPIKKSDQALKGSTRGEAMDELMSMLSSGKVHLKRAKNKAPVREEQPPLVLSRSVLRRQVTVPKGESELLASLEDSPYNSLDPMRKESIDDRLRLNRRQRQSSEPERSSELFQKLNQRLKTSKEPDQPDTVAIPRIDSTPPPPINNNNNKDKQTAKRKTTPVPLTHSPIRSPVFPRKLEEIKPIPEETETEPSSDVSPPPLPEKRLQKAVSLNPPPLKTQPVSPLAKQISCDSLKQPDAPSVKSKPSLKGPILPPNNREFVPITAKPRESLKRQKSASTPPAPIPVKPANLKSLFKRDSKSNSNENLSPQRLARAGTEGDITEDQSPGTETISDHSKSKKVFGKN